MSTACLSPDYPLTQSLASSNEARFVEKKNRAVHGDLDKSFALGLDGRGVFNELAAVAEECREPGWDAQGAAPVTRESYLLAREFLAALPFGVALPSAGAEPDGQLTLEWYAAPRRVLSVSFSPEGELHYAALLGAARRYGTEPFLGSVPRSIAEIIREVSRG